jgi:hypothetical protein
MRQRAALWLACLAAIAVSGGVRAQTVFTASGAAASLDCRGGAALVQGSGNRLSIGGACRSLGVVGSGNVVAIDLAPGAPVRVSGSDNRVLYRFAAGPPRAETSGADNQVLPDPRASTLVAVMAPPPPLLLDAASPYDLACGGRDVVVRGDGLRFVLRGGCRSLSVQGSSDRITAELLPGAAVSIGGSAVILNYVLVAEGPAPVVRVTRAGLKATQIQNYGDSELSLPTFR